VAGGCDWPGAQVPTVRGDYSFWESDVVVLSGAQDWRTCPSRVENSRTKVGYKGRI